MSSFTSCTSYRCFVCGVSWPVHQSYLKCPTCLSGTWLSDREPVDLEAAESARKHAEFERYYEEWEVRRFCQELEAA